jgi:hypothetical protein
MSTMSTDETVGYDVFVAEPIPQSVTGVLDERFYRDSVNNNFNLDRRKKGRLRKEHGQA